MSGWLGHLVAFLKVWVILEPGVGRGRDRALSFVHADYSSKYNTSDTDNAASNAAKSETVTRTDRVLDDAATTRMKRESQGS